MASTTTTQFIKTRALVLFFLCILFVPVGISLAATPNLISNGNFETADSINPNFPQNWSNGGFGSNTPVFTYPEIGIGNSKAVKITLNSYSSGDVKWVMTPVSVIPGHAYTYTDSYISNVPTQLIVEYTDASSTVVFGNFTSVSATASSTWGMASATFTVPTGVVSVRVYHTLSSVGSLLLDDASLVEVASLPPTITITPLNLPSVIINTLYSQVITASTTAAGPFVWSILSGALPQGVTLGTSVGATTTISGVPTATSTNAFTVGVSNSTSNASRPYTISVVGSSASVKVITTVVNSYGETNLPSDFTISVNGANASPSFFSGSALGTIVSVTPLSTYVVTTNPGLFYTVAYSPDCRSTISSSDTVTCTITLKDIPPLPAGQSPNLVRNPSLEVADPTASTVPQFWSTGGYGVNDRAFVYPVQGVAAGEGGVSGIAGKVTISSYTNGDAKWIFQNISVIPGHTYVYTDNYLSGQTTSLAVGYTTPTGGVSFATFATVPPSQGTSTWSTATIQFTPPAGATSTVV